MRKKLFSLFFLLFWFRAKKIIGKEKGIIIILIDGLSYNAFHTAIKKGYCPTLKKMSSRYYPLTSYYCGLPAATTATEALLFYGNNFNIPGFTWFDRGLQKFVRGNRSGELSEFEDSYDKKRNLLQNGSAIMSVYTGGATELSLSGRNLSFSHSLYFVKTAHYFLMALLYPVQLIRTIYLTLKTLVLYRRANRHSAVETFSKIVLGQFSCFLTEIEIMRNTQKIFIDFLLYDEFAHEYGPTHTTTLSTLRLIDRYINRIVKTAKKTERKYEIIVLSDHGQTESIPFDDPKIQSIEDIKIALDNTKYSVVKTYGGITPSRDKKELYVVPAGSTLQVYFSDYLQKGAFETEIESTFPHFISRLLTYEEFGWVLVKKTDSSSQLYGKCGSVVFENNGIHTIIGAPFPSLSSEEIKKTVSSFTYYSSFPNNGDIVLFGNTTKQNKVYSFEKHKGTHGGFYGPMVHPFIMSSNPLLVGDSMSSLFDTIAVMV